MSKTIEFNPDLMKITPKRSRASASASPKIRVREPPKAAKKSILAYMNKKQHANFKEGTHPAHPAHPAHDFDDEPHPATVFGDDFGDSLQYMTDVAKRYKETKAAAATTDTAFNKPDREEIYAPRLSYTVRATSPVLTQPLHATPSKKSADIVNAPDSVVHGCLKNGRLPTYRQYRRTLRQPVATGLGYNLADPPPHTIPPPMMAITNLSPAAGVAAAATATPKRAGHKYKRQKKTIKRTFTVGKSKTDNSIGILVSSRTVRSKVKDRLAALKETPIAEVRRYLLKNALIKAGSSPPHAILREMYESAHMLCGEVKNTSVDNLLFNFLHDDDK